MTRHRIAQIGENRNPKSPETRPQTRRFLQIRLLQLRRSATPFNGLAVLHGRLNPPKGYQVSDFDHLLCDAGLPEGAGSPFSATILERQLTFLTMYEDPTFCSRGELA